MKIFKVTVKDLHEIEWINNNLPTGSLLPDATITFIGEQVFENDDFIILRYSRFHENIYNLPEKCVGVKLPKVMIIEKIELKEERK